MTRTDTWQWRHGWSVPTATLHACCSHVTMLKSRPAFREDSCPQANWSELVLVVSALDAECRSHDSSPQLQRFGAEKSKLLNTVTTHKCDLFFKCNALFTLACMQEWWTHAHANRYAWMHTHTHTHTHTQSMDQTNDDSAYCEPVFLAFDFNT